MMKLSTVSLCVLLTVGGLFGGGPGRAGEAGPKVEPGPQNENVDLTFQDSEAMTVLAFFARLTGKAFLPEDEMAFKLTIIAPHPVPRKTALDMLDAALSLKGYSLVERADFIKVVKKQGAAQESLRAMTVDTPDDRFVTETMRLEYAAVAKVQESMKPLLTPAGKMVINEPLNTLILTDTAANVRKLLTLIKSLDDSAHAPSTRVYPVLYADPEKLAQLLNQVYQLPIEAKPQQVKIIAAVDQKQLIVSAPQVIHQDLEKVLTKLDSRTKQVLIEVYVVDVALDEDSRLGIEWQTATQTALGGASVAAFGTPFVSSNSILAGVQGLKYSFLKAHEFGSLLQAFAQSERSEVLAAPHLATMDGKEATLDVTQQVPVLKEVRYDDQDQQIQTYDHQTVGILTAITPRIAQNRDVMLAIHQEVSELLDYDPEKTTYKIGTRKASSNVVVKDGHTLVIGGLMQKSIDSQSGGVPLLRRIPILGAAFRNKTLKGNKSELLIFITPRVIEDVAESDAMNEHQQNKHRHSLDVTGEEFRL